ncbi:tape measure protein [Microbacterium phage Gingerbug]|nr:tape measure protein [Microbacterium phage Gingerbug]
MDIGTLVGHLELDTDKWEGPLASVGQKMPGWMAAAGAGAALAVGAAFSAALGNAIDIQAGNAKVAAQLGLTEDEAARAGEAAAGAYTNNFGESMEDVQGITASVIGSIKGMRDASVDELQGIVEKVATLSGAFGIEADRISQVVGQMLSTGMAANAQEGIDLLTAALQKVPPAVREDIVDAVDEYGPFFASVGMSGEEAMSALVAASEKGMYGIDKTGDAVKEFSIRATDMSTTSVAAYEAAGLSAEEMSAKILAGGEQGKDGFQQVIDGLLGIEDPVARANAAIGLFGTPLEDLGVNEIPQFLEGLKGIDGGLGDVKGAADEMAATMGDTVAAQWQTLQRSFEMIVTTVAGQLLPVLQPLLEWLTSNPAVLQAVALGLGVLATAFIGLSVATWAANAAFLASPITWIILGIVALVAALVWLISNWDMVVAWISEVWSGFIAWLGEVMDGFVAWWNDLWAGVGQWIQDVWNGFTSWVQSVFEGFVGWLTGIGDGIATWWNGLWAAIGAWIQSVWQGFIGFVTGVFNGYVSWLRSVGAGIASWWNGLWSGIGSFIQSIWTGFIGFVQGVWNGFSGWIMGALNGFTSFWSGLWNGVNSAVRSIWSGIIAWFRGIPQMIFDVFSGAGQWLYNIGRDVLNGLWNGLKDIWNNLTSWIGDIGSSIADTFAGVLGIHSPSRVFREFGLNIGEGLIQGLQAIEPRVALATEDMAHVPDPSRAAADGPQTAESGSKVFHYHAAENQSLSDEEALFAALGSPRSPFGGK